ncbi:MAG TPA: cyclase family protein [Candidatus Latescibacteria bacterium]|nr:cyclase family protein [Candidatus Handelsmanbacteria bacterium]HIL09037.1 cyclase family protein [Candidatus Latescibacterota bacterium]
MNIIDLSLTMRTGMRGIAWDTHTTLAEEGWNSRTLHLYSHATTHMDAPRHFFERGLTIDYQDLNKCIGPAFVVDLGEVAPRQLIGVADLGPLAKKIGPGDRLLFKSGWSKRVDEPAYRDELPRISLELAEFLAAKLVALVGVEPPSVAAINDLEEITAVHRTLLGAGVIIVEGLCNLDQLTQEQVTFIALPLKVEDGDGTPVRAIAIEGDLAGLAP